MTPDQAKAKTQLLIATEINSQEMTLRMVEAATMMRRPPGMALTDALATLDPDTLVCWSRAAKAALEYISERLKQAGSVQ